MQEGDAEEKTAREHNKLNYSNETSVKQRGKKYGRGRNNKLSLSHCLLSRYTILCAHHIKIRRVMCPPVSEWFVHSTVKWPIP
jgi:hypothetical protein